ncbi:N-methyltransferase tcpN [Lachnellula arida]|uniref:N-methyltransferase tcpN n=1 Tax=Lachnellula arida TaxID=1316785 RepID=A0A8T9B6E9_9HELO|nr:N-methyltransferase tcpN [Lachnellula arida]
MVISWQEATWLQQGMLNLLCYLWKDAMGYILHPSIQMPGKEWRVADVGAGTGLWLTKLAQIAPKDSQLDGYDISSDQFPAASLTPGNINFRISDAKMPPPEGLWESYDIVHVRLLATIVDNGDPSPILQHCLKLLKPGGYLQWEELDFAAIYEQKDLNETFPCIAMLAKLWATTKPSR